MDVTKTQEWQANCAQPCGVGRCIPQQLTQQKNKRYKKLFWYPLASAYIIDVLVLLHLCLIFYDSFCKRNHWEFAFQQPAAAAMSSI